MKAHKWYTLIFGSAFLLTVGFVLHVYQLFYMAAAWGLLAPLSYLLTRINLQKLDVTRSLASRAVAGEPVKASLTVHNRAGRRRFLFTVEDVLPPSLQASDDPYQVVADLAPYERRSFHYEVVPEQRGVYQLGDLKLASPDLLGMYEFYRRLPQAQELIVYPKPLALPNVWMPTPAGVATRTLTRRKNPQGPDIYGVREYVPGDDLRHIHWKASAHTNKLVVTEREEQHSLGATVILDLSRNVHIGVGSHSTLEYSVTLAASLLALALRQGGAAQLIAWGSRDWSVPFTRPDQSQTAILEALARVRADSADRLLQVLDHRRKQLSRAGAVAIISPQTGPEMLTVAATLQAWGNSLIWFPLFVPSFGVPSAAADGAQVSYHHFIEQLRAHRCRVYPIRGDLSLIANFRGWQRVAG